MTINKSQLCKGKIKSGKSCQRKAGSSGYCNLHNPSMLEDQSNQDKKIKVKEARLNELINMVVKTCNAKGWYANIKSIDNDTLRYATLSVSRTGSSGEVHAIVEISHDKKVTISTEQTSFYGHGLDSLRKAFKDGINDISWLKPIDEKPKQDYLDALYRILKRFEILIRQLKHRYAKREPVKISDEYDVQYILHALLRGLFTDVRAEEVSPSYAGASSRLDFLLKNEKVVVETKMTNASLKDKQIGEQLIIDIERYQAHPDCKTLICFVYDPDNYIINPAGLENDLSRKTDKLEVIVFVVPH